MRQNSVNHLLHSVSTDSTNRFKSIMNSPNFGNQQILLQSCCFFDSERSQTPHASNTIIKDFDIKVKSKSGSPKIPKPNKKIYHYKNIGIQEKINSTKSINNKDKIANNNEEHLLMISKLKKDNKGLKKTIKNLTSQLDRVVSIAEKAKNNEINSLQSNNFTEEEKKSLINKIEVLTKEKEKLKKEIEKKEEEYQNYRINHKIEEINNKNKIIDNEKKHRRFVSELNNEFENIKQMNNSLSITVNKEINDNKKYKLIINKLNQENEQLRKRIDEHINISINKLKEQLSSKEKNIENLTKENINLKINIDNLKTIEKKYEDVNNENKILNKLNNKYNSLKKQKKKM